MLSNTKIDCIYLMLTENCNLRCVYCYEQSKASSVMTLNLAKSSVDMLFTSGSNKLLVELFGGEPLLNFDVIKHIIPYIRSKEEETGKQCKIGMSTNLTLLTDDMIDVIEEIDDIQFSIDGIAKVQNKNRPMANGKDSFDMVDVNLPKVARPSINYSVRITIQPDNVKYLAESVIFYHNKYGINNIKTQCVQETTWSEKEVKEYQRQLRMISDYMYGLHRSGKSFTFDPLSHYLGLPPYINPDKTCGAGHKSIGITPNGDIYPCLRFYTYDRNRGTEDYKMGSIHTGINLDKSSIFRSYNRSSLEKCYECEHDSYCDRCLACNLEVCGDMFVSPSEHCKTVKVDSIIGKQLRDRLNIDNLQQEKLSTLIDGMNNKLSSIISRQKNTEDLFNSITPSVDSLMERLINLENTNNNLRLEVADLKLELRRR